VPNEAFRSLSCFGGAAAGAFKFELMAWSTYVEQHVTDSELKAVVLLPWDGDGNNGC
jgi:hypothetical protein